MCLDMNYPQSYYSQTYYILLLYPFGPLSCVGREYMALLVECLEYLSNTRDTIILVGDLNLPSVDLTLLNSPDDGIQSEFCVGHGL